MARPARKKSGRYSRWSPDLRSLQLRSVVDSLRDSFGSKPVIERSDPAPVSNTPRPATRRTGAKRKQRGERSKPEQQLSDALIGANCGFFVEEYVFHPPRRWRFDFAFVGHRLAVEVEGGVWVRGRHNRPQGFIDDCTKYNQAVLDGWRVLRFVPRTAWTTEAVDMIKEALSAS